MYDAQASECLGEYAISSYTTTLNALLSPPALAADPFGKIEAVQLVTKEAPLPSTEEELYNFKNMNT